MFAEDTAQLEDSEEKLCRQVSEIDRVSERSELRGNVGTSRVINCLRKGCATGFSVGLNGLLLEEVDCFKNLGSHVAMRERAWNRGNVWCKKMGALNGLMKSRTGA